MGNVIIIRTNGTYEIIRVDGFDDIRNLIHRMFSFSNEDNYEGNIYLLYEDGDYMGDDGPNALASAIFDKKEFGFVPFWNDVLVVAYDENEYIDVPLNEDETNKMVAVLERKRQEMGDVLVLHPSGACEVAKAHDIDDFFHLESIDEPKEIPYGDPSDHLYLVYDGKPFEEKYDKPNLLAGFPAGSGKFEFIYGEAVIVKKSGDRFTYLSDGDIGKTIQAIGERKKSSGKAIVVRTDGGFEWENVCDAETYLKEKFPNKPTVKALNKTGNGFCIAYDAEAGDGAALNTFVGEWLAKKGELTPIYGDCVLIKKVGSKCKPLGFGDARKAYNAIMYACAKNKPEKA